MKAKKREQHVRSFLVRSNNARQERLCEDWKRKETGICPQGISVQSLQENPREKISFNRFCNKRSKEIKFVKYAQGVVCLCFKHTNFALKLKTLGKALPRFDDVDPDHFLEKYEAKDVDALLHNITDSVTLSEWKRIQMENRYKKISFVTQDVPAVDFKNKSSEEYPVFVKH